MHFVRDDFHRLLTPGRLAALVATGALLLACGSVSLALGATPAGKAADAEAAAKKKKKAKTCIIHRYTGSGKKVVFKVYVYQYKTVRRNGRRVRTIVKRKVPLRGSCAKSKACVKVKVTAVGKVAIVYSRKKVRVRVKKGNKLVYRTVKKKVPVLGKCVKPGTTAADLGVPVKITILPAISKATLDFGSFTRETPIGGTIKGYSPQPKIDITKDIPIIFTSAAITLGSTPIFIDQDCNDRVTAALRTGKGANVILDGSRESTSLLTTQGVVTASTFFKVRLPLELRDGENGCDKPYISTQYSEWPLKLFLTGKLDPKTGLTKLRVRSAPILASDLIVCLNPGLQTEPCSGFQIPLPIFISTDVYVTVDLNTK